MRLCALCIENASSSRQPIVPRTQPFRAFRPFRGFRGPNALMISTRREGAW